MNKITDISEIDKEIKTNFEEKDQRKVLINFQESILQTIRTEIRQNDVNIVGYYKQKCKLLEQEITELKNKLEGK